MDTPRSPPSSSSRLEEGQEKKLNFQCYITNFEEDVKITGYTDEYKDKKKAVWKDRLFGHPFVRKST
jgi:hypothetical protein